MTTAHAPPVRLPAAAVQLLDDFRTVYGGTVEIWRREGEQRELLYGDAGSGSHPGESEQEVAAGLDLCICGGTHGDRERHFLAASLRRVLQLDGEVIRLSSEIAGRYEEITLLYSISETLGSVISLEEAAGKILHEVIGILRARRAALWVHDPVEGVLYLAAAEGMNGQSGPIRLDDRTSVTARVFQENRPVVMDPGDVFPRGDLDRGTTQRGSFLSVPVSYSPPRGIPRTVGVINLVGRESDEPFTAGDEKLLSAIASQVGAAVENGRLVAESLRQERLVRELELARDLQLKLLPSAERFADYARVAARCVPAHTVGGDFYHLFRLPERRFGVMIGDVSSHGFSAALIMALTMSAVAIHASEGHEPGEVLRRVHRALIEELESTEMFMTLFYGVLDPVAERIDFANAGHHHAFRIDSTGAAERLAVTNPPLGMIDLDAYTESSTSWVRDRDLLFLFTDGLSDALGFGDAAGEQRLLDMVADRREEAPDTIIGELFAEAAAGDGGALDDRTAVIVRA
jgi:phosphoserine phosphatase RsbU/P